MSVIRRRLTVGLVAAAGLTALAGSLTPAYAAPPPWPTAGKVPVGCASVVPAGSGTGTSFTFTDTSVPTVHSSGVTFVGGARTLALPPGITPVPFEVRVANDCSGVGGVVATILRPNGTTGSGAFAPVGNDAFSGTWRSSASPATVANVGGYTWLTVGVARRYDSFVLDSSFKVSSTTPHAGGSTSVVGPWSTKPVYLLRATTLTSTVSKSKVARGKKVTVGGVLKYAGPASYLANAGGKVVVQTKVGKGGWKNRTTLTANAGGAVAWKLKITKKTQIRLVSNQVLSGLFTAAVTSATKTVKLA